MIYTLLAVCSLDGKIARHAFHFTDWASEEDQKHFKKFLNNSQVLLVGNNTFKTANEQLSRRNCVVLSKSINKIEKVNEKLCYINPKNADVHDFLKQMNYTNITVLGGGQTYAWSLEQKVSTEILLTLEPLVFGNGIPLFSTEHAWMKSCKLLSVKQLNEQGTLLLHYKVLE